MDTTVSVTGTCRAVEPLLVDMVVGRAGAVDRQIVDEHLARCSACASARAEFSASWRRLDAWKVPAPSAHAERAVFARVRGDLSTTTAPRSIAAGLDLSRGVAAGLWAAAALVALSLVYPVGNLADVCHGSTGFTALFGRGASAYFVAGLLYGLVPGALGLLATRGHGRRGLRAALPVALVIAAFELPVFYLQCQPFAAGALATTLGGAVLGASLATLTDLRWFGHGARTIS